MGPDKPDKPDAREAPRIVGEIPFDGVEFEYRERRPVVRDSTVAYFGMVQRQMAAHDQNGDEILR
jgi:hypothetical protein